MRTLFLLLLLAAAPARAQPATTFECPDNIGAAAELNCRCTAEATQNSSTIWGNKTYTADSPVCVAARHAGVIGPAGGAVRLRATGPQQSFAAARANGVASVEYGPYPGSFTVAAGVEGPTACPPNAERVSGSFACTCPASDTPLGRGDVWGSDIYTIDSDICRAAIHSGFVTPAGGTVRLRILPGQARYQGSARNGISTMGFARYGGSFSFEGDRVGAGPPTGPQACPETMEGELARTEPLVCACPADVTTGMVWGTDAYTGDSTICRAALHAGATRRAGGLVTIRILPGLPRYVGTTRNGQSSTNYGPFASSFRFEGVSTGPQICPDNMTAYAGSTETVDCLCTGEAAMAQAPLWGSGPYTADSGVCRAARHAGVAPATGGQVRVVMQGAQSRYMASNRNGINSAGYDAYPASFIFEGAQNVAVGAPVQAPVADALRRTGKVSLYVTFRTNSADLDISAAPVLGQVRDAMAAEPGLRLRLVGHTDAQGTPATNQPLSQRRAAAVAAWLVQNGVAAARLVAEGRGQSQPIADNATEAGRAVNRRVEAERVD